MAPYSSADLALCFSVDLQVDNESPCGDEAVLASPVVAIESFWLGCHSWRPWRHS